MTMTKNYKILAKFIKDASSETADIETYLFVKENISKYHLNIEITSKALKNKLVEVNTILKFEDKEPNEKKSYYEIVYATIIKVDENMASEPCNDLRSFQGLKCSLERSPTIAAMGSAIARVAIEIKKVIGFSQKKTDKIRTDIGKIIVP